MMLRVDSSVTLTVNSRANAWRPRWTVARVPVEMGFRLELKALAGPLRGKVLTFAADEQVVFGRASEGQKGELPQDDPCASRRHFQLDVEAPWVWVQDLGSTHGTFVNGRVCPRADCSGQVTPRVAVHSGDIIQAGGTRFQVTLSTNENLFPAAGATGCDLRASRNREGAPLGPPASDHRAMQSAPRVVAPAPGRLILKNRLGPPQIEGFDIERSLGRNALGTAFLCRHHLDGRLGVIKVIRVNQDLGPELSDLLEEACTTLRALRHENIVHVQDHGVVRFGTEGWGLCLETEYCDGGSVEEAVAEKGGRLPAHEIHDLMRDCLAGLACAHAQGIVHGNLKPSNLLFARKDGRRCAKLADFALLPVLQRVLAGTGMGGDPGPETLPFMPPEQAGSPHMLSQTADVWSLGAVFHYLLSGHHPRVGGAIDSAGSNSLPGRLVSVREHYRVVPPSLGGLLDLIDRALAAFSEDRFPSGIEMWKEFQRLPRPPAVRVEWP